MLPKRSFVAVSISVVAALAACSGSSSKTGDDGSSSTSAGTSGTKKPGGGTTGGGTQTGDDGSGDDTTLGAGGGILVMTPPTASSGAFFLDDPPAPQCAGGTPVVPGGTPQCPDDKNYQGCPCPNVGATASCFSGYRKNENRGICKSGTTTCIADPGEIGSSWGPCDGEVLPATNPTTSADMCECFSAGKWQIDDIEPCFITDESHKVIQAVSTCPSGPITTPMAPLPSVPWSTDSLDVDCAGTYTLTYTLRAGNVATPSPNDCIVQSVSVTADYTTANVVQKLPDLPAWTTTTPAQVACAAAFNATGGYGEMEVVGTSAECDQITDHVFTRLGYCPGTCANDPTSDMCKGCQAGAGGTF